MIIVSVAKDFTLTPGPRYRDEGSYSGEQFRETVLAGKIRDAIARNEKICIDLDGTAGYGTSFLEESFGGLIREEHIPYAQIHSILKIKSDEKPKYIREVETYLKRAHEKAIEAVY